MAITLLSIMAFIALLVTAALWDVVSFTIPNALTLAVAALFVPHAILAGLGLGQIGLHLLAGTVGFAIGFAMFAFGWIGGGDAKLFAASALWFGISDLLFYALSVSIVGGVLTLILLSFRRLALPTSLVRHEWIMRLHEERGSIPYGVALAVGALLILPYTEIARF